MANFLGSNGHVLWALLWGVYRAHKMQSRVDNVAMLSLKQYIYFNKNINGILDVAAVAPV